MEDRDADEREACILNMVAILDREMALSPQQQSALIASLSANWIDAWSPTVETAVIQGQSFVPNVPDELIEPHLDPGQKETWEQMQKFATTRWNPRSFQFTYGVLPNPEDE